MDGLKIKFDVILLSFLLLSGIPSNLGMSKSMRGTTRSEPEAFQGGNFPAMKIRKLMATNMEVDYSSDYYDGGSSSPSPPVPDYDDIYRRQGDVPSPGIGH
ncbi:hypothetical protein ISN44_As09g025670 [Arabidopsis suecica]|uniref:Uncharacterized protein n=1 Tax=Arabidopsis suecica TaxID=45249 RepID=A0A8T2AL49_ARASU|nr:hypothetical protein ISN44_As09g025670 [Arabidopsis suecica]